MAKQKGFGWTILAAALTNMPIAQQRGNPISIVEKDGVEYLRVPLIKKCKIRYRDQILTFDQGKFDQMLENHQSQVWDSPPYIRIGHKDSPGLSWFAQVKGETPHGKMVQEQDWLVAYALPTDEDVKKAERGYKFSSIDLHPDYSSNQLELAFSSQDFEEVTDEEEDMSGNGEEITLSKEEYQKLMSESAANETTVKLQAQVDALAVDKTAWEAEKLELEARQAKDRRAIYLSTVENIIEKASARRGKDGKSALPAFVLTTAASILKFETISGDSGTIKLERDGGDGVANYVDYVVDAISYMLSNMPIESMPVEGATTHEEGAPGKEKIKFGMDEKVLDDFYDDEVKDFYGMEVQQ